MKSPRAAREAAGGAENARRGIVELSGREEDSRAAVVREVDVIGPDPADDQHAPVRKLSDRRVAPIDDHARAPVDARLTSQRPVVRGLRQRHRLRAEHHDHHGEERDEALTRHSKTPSAHARRTPSSRGAIGWLVRRVKTSSTQAMQYPPSARRTNRRVNDPEQRASPPGVRPGCRQRPATVRQAREIVKGESTQ